MALSTKVGVGPGDVVVDGDPASRQKGHSTQFSTRVCCGQTAGLIKMPLDMEVGRSPGHIVLHVPQLPPRGHSLPVFGPCLLYLHTNWPIKVRIRCR